MICSWIGLYYLFYGHSLHFFQFGNAYLSVLKIFLVRFSLHFMYVHKLSIGMYACMLTSTIAVFVLYSEKFTLSSNFPTRTFILAIIFWRALVILYISIHIAVFSNCLSSLFSISLRILTIGCFFQSIVFTPCDISVCLF